VNIYMLNLIFDASDPDAATNSRFQPDNTSQTDNCLLRSKVWLKANTPNPDVVATDYANIKTNWQVLCPDDGDALQLAVQDQVWIRVQGLNITTDWVARLTVLVSRDTKRAAKNPANSNRRYQTRASPFPSGQLAPLNNQSCVLYDFEHPTYQSIQSGSWLQPLGTVTFTTPTGNGRPTPFLDKYSVIVAITAGLGPVSEGGDPTNLRRYAHDPDMDVQC